MNKKQALGSKRLTPEERAEIVTLRREGLHVGEITHKLGLNRNTVAKWIVKAGLPISRRPPIPEKKAKQMLALLRKRVERRKIGRMLGISHRAVSAFAREHGFCKPKKEVTQATVLLVDAILKRESATCSIRKGSIRARRKLATSAQSFTEKWRDLRRAWQRSGIVSNLRSMLTTTLFQG